MWNSAESGLIGPEIQGLVARALSEDLGAGDPTTQSLIPPGLTGKAVIVSKASGVVAGCEITQAVFRAVDAGIKCTWLQGDGAQVDANGAIGEVEGAASSLLSAERTALNFLRHLSGIATETRKYVEATAGHRAQILDTRKTTPGLRRLEKYAVRMGGGKNHRQNLGDGVLIKDNHIAALRLQGKGLKDAVTMARAGAPHTLKIEVEVETLEQVGEAIDAGADILLLDNMSVEQMAEAVQQVGGRALTEASGDVTLDNVREVAATGVDLISVGALTHSAPVLNISMDLSF